MSGQAHFGDPCVKCGVGHDDVALGPCPGAPARALDTSGHVQLTNTKWVRCVQWSDLTPFTQGYVEALFAAHQSDLREPVQFGTGFAYPPFGFRHLAPATLARIIEDCAAVLKIVDLYADPEKARNQGVVFWTARQNGRWELRAVAPLTPHLGDDGLIYTREAGQ